MKMKIKNKLKNNISCRKAREFNQSKTMKIKKIIIKSIINKINKIDNEY